MTKSGKCQGTLSSKYGMTVSSCPFKESESSLFTSVARKLRPTCANPPPLLLSISALFFGYCKSCIKLPLRCRACTVFKAGFRSQWGTLAQNAAFFQLCESLLLSNALEINKPRSGLINDLLQERQINDLTTSQVTKARKNCVCRLDALFCLIFSPVLGLLVRRLFRRYPYHRN